MAIERFLLYEFIHFPKGDLVGRPSEYFALKARGFSMTGAGIDNGDLVIFRRATEPENGKIMLILYEDAATMKRIIERDGVFYLCWEDGSGKEIEVNSPEYHAQGILAHVVKNCEKVR